MIIHRFLRAGFIILFMYPYILFTTFSNAQDTIEKQIIIKVQSKLIALPGNEASKVPFSAARVRSTELRNLNKQYNAVKIEKLFALEEAGDTPDISQVFTNRVRKEQIALGNKVVQVKDMFLIHFQLDPLVNISSLLDAYTALPGVISADETTIIEEDTRKTKKLEDKTKKKKKKKAKE